MPSPSAQRRAALDLAAHHQLTGSGLAQLRAALGLEQALPSLQPAGLSRGVMVLAAALGGLGLLMWLAANWGEMSHLLRFGLLQFLVLVMAVGAWLRPRWRAPLGLLAFVATGGLFAFFGMTYQTGADPWQLFALWAVLTLPLAVALRSDVLWAPWLLVAMVGISLWTHTQAGHQWWPRPGRAWPYAVQCLLAGLLVAGVNAGPVARWVGVGLWGRRTAMVLWLAMLVPVSSYALWQSDLGWLFLLGAALTAALAWVLSRPVWCDVFSLSAVMLGANVLLFSGVLRLLGGDGRFDWIGSMFLLALVMAAALAGTGRWVMHVAKAAAGQERSA